MPAIQTLAKLRDPQAVYLLRGMVLPGEPVLVRLATAGALAQLGIYSKEGYEFCLRTVQDPVQSLSEAAGGKVEIGPDEAAKAEILAAISLGQMGNVVAVDSLQTVLRSADGKARVAAAKSILTLLPAYKRSPPLQPQTPVVKPAPPVVKPPPPATQPAPPVVKPPPPAPPVVKPPPPATKPAPPVVKPPPPATKPAPRSRSLRPRRPRPRPPNHRRRGRN